MFERAHHRSIARVLAALNAERLVENGCLFGGGTAMTLRFGEYRESVDIDFLVSHLDGYRNLRQMLTSADGLRAIKRPLASLQAVREVRADQYGIRTVVQADDVQIKFEIVLEARIQLDAPSAADCVCGVATLTPLDMAASKLLANSDRWADASVFSRDVIDLAMMQAKPALLKQGMAKAQGAYGKSIEADLAKAIARLLETEGWLERCMAALQITQPKAVIWKRVRALQKAAA